MPYRVGNLKADCRDVALLHETNGGHCAERDIRHRDKRRHVCLYLYDETPESREKQSYALAKMTRAPGLRAKLSAPSYFTFMFVVRVCQPEFQRGRHGVFILIKTRMTIEKYNF